jgi:hypothetical protein
MPRSIGSVRRTSVLGDGGTEVSEQDAGGGSPDPTEDDVAEAQAMTEEEIEALPEAPPEVAEFMERAIERLMRREPLGSPCPECGSTDTAFVTIGRPEGDRLEDGGWTVLLPPGVFLSYCECSACENTWEAGKA